VGTSTAFHQSPGSLKLPGGAALVIEMGIRPAADSAGPAKGEETALRKRRGGPRRELHDPILRNWAGGRSSARATEPTPHQPARHNQAAVQPRSQEPMYAGDMG